MAASAPSDDVYFDLGSYWRPVTTQNRVAQTWFNRGLIWCYGFNHEEAAECFQKAIDADADCIMAYWGLAYALGPNYNKPWQLFDADELKHTVAQTHAAVEEAHTRSANASPVEKALVAALEMRYPQSEAAADCAVWNQHYAGAMRLVYEEFPDDLDVATLYSDALMNLTPWKLWDLRIGQPAPRARTMEVKAILDRAFTLPGGLAHPGLLHLYIHLMEQSPTPEVALPVADRLRGLVPDAGHLNHMPTHLDILCGDYRRATAGNLDAIRADDKFFVKNTNVRMYALYRCHDFHFRLYAAMFSGQSKLALETVTWLEASLPEKLLRVKMPPMVDWLESFLGMRVHVLIRFGMWQDLIDMDMPHNQDLYCMTSALICYGKAVALSATGRVHEAEAAHTQFRDAAARVKPSRMLFNNTCHDILTIADSMLHGELEYRKGNFDAAFFHLRHSIALDDALPYDEPWGWMQPPRHAYGALLLEQGHVQEAAAVYSADLGLDETLPRSLRHPNNVWALHGYHECLVRLGRTAEARILKPQLTFALATTDVPVRSSCFCRTKTASHHTIPNEPRL